MFKISNFEKYMSLFAKVELKDKISEEKKLITGFQNLKGDIIKELDELKNMINSKENKDVNQLRDLYDKFYDEYIDEIDTFPEEKTKQLNSLDNQITNLESQEEARYNSKTFSLLKDCCKEYN